MISETLKDRFKQEVQRRGFYPYDAAKFCGLGSGVVIDCMNRGKVPCARRLAIICVAFDLSADYLLGLSDENKPLNPQCTFENVYTYGEVFIRRIRTIFKTRKELWAFCKQIGISGNSMYRPYSYGSFPTIETCVKMATYAGVSLDWLLGLSDKGGPEE